MHRQPPRSPRAMGFTLVEVLIASTIIVLTIVPSIITIQVARARARAVGINLIGENLAVAMMELIKRSGYSEIAYGQDLPDILDTAGTVNPLLDFPRKIGSSAGADAQVLPAGAPGGVSDTAMSTFLDAVHGGTASASSTVISSNTNYLFFSADQIAAMNGYANAAAVPGGTTVLDPKYAWALYVHLDAAGNAGGVVGYPLKHVVVIVKWRDPRRNRADFTVLESYVSSVAPRL